MFKTQPTDKIGALSFYNADNLEIMRGFKDNEFDLAIVDIPYGLGDKLTQGGTWASKYKKGDAEFDLPQRLLDLYKKKDFGPYKDKKGYMPVNFLSDNDITGGNSGSPILNGNGELIGLAFDGNSEALSGDIVFEKQWQKTINLDVRFLLWVMDKYHGAGYLLNEMTIRK